MREGLRLQEGWELRGRERGQGQEWGEPRSLAVKEPGSVWNHLREVAGMGGKAWYVIGSGA